MGIESIQQNPVASKEVKKTESTTKKKTESAPVIQQKKPKPVLSEADKKVEKTMKKDFATGVLTREDASTLREKIQKAFGTKVDEDYVVFHYDKFQEQNKDKKLTYGDIVKRYNLPKGTLKSANDLGFETYQMKDGKGDDISKYEIGTIGKGDTDVRIPASAVKKYLMALETDK